jgi:hypothetical protein
MSSYNGATFLCKYRFINKYGLLDDGSIYVSSQGPEVAYKCAVQYLSTKHNNVVIYSCSRASIVDVMIEYIIDIPDEEVGDSDIFEHNDDLSGIFVNYNGSVDRSTWRYNSYFWPICVADRFADFIYIQYDKGEPVADNMVYPHYWRAIDTQQISYNAFQARYDTCYKFRFYTGPYYNPVLGPVFTYTQEPGLLPEDPNFDYNLDEYPPEWNPYVD